MRGKQGGVLVGASDTRYVGPVLPGSSAAVRPTYERLAPCHHPGAVEAYVPMMHRSHQVTANAEEVADESMHGHESLCLPGRCDPSHLSLALPCGLVGDFGAIVLVSVRAMGDGRHDRSVRSPVAAQLVGAQPPRRTLLALQQLAEKACSRPVVATRLDEDIDDLAILIDGTPERRGRAHE